ncbi:MAG: Crp/Fnr family transcriptional regulator [Acidobacteriia bacterium]|nr:Crp/Fnr family transcriptional regulator [Terriglobia bacterium]
MSTYRTPYNLQPSESCDHCGARSAGFFCQLPAATLKRLEAISFVTSYPHGAVLFVEGQAPRGVYMICRGQAKLSVVSPDGRTLILKIAGPGEVLGLSACVMDKAYEATVETLSPCQVNFIRREDFLRFVREDSEACLLAAIQISKQYNNACRELRWVGLSRSADWRLASLLLGWGEDHSEGNVTNESPSFKMTLTHEEIAQMIGTTRETVTRAMARFKKQKLIEVRGATLVLRNQKMLLEIAGRGALFVAPLTTMPHAEPLARQNSAFRVVRDKQAACAIV